jgi:hypothetical protein
MKMKETKTKTKQDDELFKNLGNDALVEFVQFLGVKEDKIPKDATREQLIELIHAAQRKDIAVAQAIKTPDGKEYDCPPGHMVIKVTPKAGQEWGVKSRALAFFAVQGQACVVERGKVVVIPDRYRSAWQDAVRIEYDDQENATPTVAPDGSLRPPKLVGREVFSEDVQVLFWNRDYEAEAAVEKDLIEGAKKFQEQRKAAIALKSAITGQIVNH